MALPETGRAFLSYRKLRFLYDKNAPRGSHCGGSEVCRKSDPPQAENPASGILFYIMVILDSKEEILMKRIAALILINILIVMSVLFTACKNKSDNDETAPRETFSQELNDEQQKALDFILENCNEVLPVYTRYEYAGDAEISDYNCCRFEFYSDEMYLGAIAKAYDDEVMFWDADHGQYMFMVNDNGWYVTGTYVNTPQETVSYAPSEATINDGKSGQYSNNNGAFYITMYEDDYAGDADGFFRAAGTVLDSEGMGKQYSIAGEFYRVEESGSLAYTEGDTEGELSYTEVYEFKKSDDEVMKFMFTEDSVYITDTGMHDGEEYNLTGNYVLNFYY